ncbi:MAG: hypothetical protein FWB86_06480 [Treponema sp.]|nr:hypothetical protein [Treponema sp.]MCL2250882.1 hypothetical protein [Treponema sp.]
MTRGTFIVGNESALCRAVEAETIKRVDKYACAFIPNKLSETISSDLSSESENEKCQSLDWNPSSPISARALVLAAENRLEAIDEAILVCSPPVIRSSPSGLSFSTVEIMVNDHIKGWFFLVKEITKMFKNRERGTLALVYPDIASGKEVDILGASALSSFRTLVQCLLSSANKEPYSTIGFSTTDSGNETAFASFIYKSIDELSKRSNGKLFKFGKFSFFK